MEELNEIDSDWEPSSRRTLIERIDFGLLVGLLLLVCAQTAAAALNTRYFLLTTPFVFTFGLLASLSVFRKSGWTATAGLCVIVFQSSIIAIIFSLGWSPYDSHVPVTWSCVLFGWAVIPWTVWGAAQPLDAEPNSRTSRQFSLRALLAVMLLIALWGGIIRQGHDVHLENARVAAKETIFLIAPGDQRPHIVAAIAGMLSAAVLAVWVMKYGRMSPTREGFAESRNES